MPITRIRRVETGGGHRVQIDAGADGSLIVLSSEDGSFLSRLNSDGTETLVAATTSYLNFRSGFVETLSDGRYALYTTNHFGLGWDARVQILNRDGSAATGVIDPGFDGGASRTLQGYSLAPTANGGFAFTFNDISRGSDQFLLTYPRTDIGVTQNNVSGGVDVRIRYFDGAGTALADSVVADDDVETVLGATVNRRAPDQFLQDSATLVGGETVWVYEDQRYVGNDGGGAHLELQLSVQISAPGDVGEPVKIDLDPFSTNSSVPQQFLNAGTGANVVPLPGGGFAVIWTQSLYTAANVFDGWSSVIRYFDAQGTALTDPIELVRRGTAHGNHSKYVWGEALPDGRIAIAYNVGVDGVNGNGRLDAFVGIVGALGSSLDVAQINPATQNTQFYTISDLAVRTDGTIDLVYNDARALANGSNRNETVIEGYALGSGAGTGGDDTLGGTSGPDVVAGLGGNDVINTGRGIDSIDGGDGNDTVNAGDDGDLVNGGGGDDWLNGGAGNDTIDGGDGNDLIIGGPGDDILSGGDGDDGFYMGAILSAGDAVDGGPGQLDQVGLQGNYGTMGAGGVPMTLGAQQLVGVELLVLLAGDDTRFGDNGTSLYSYNVKTVNENVAAGQRLVVTFNTLRAGENVRFDGSAELDGTFLTYGGLGNDEVIGGVGDDDGFFFGAQGRWGAGDKVGGGAGALDQVGLQGRYVGAQAVVFGPGQLTGVEMIVLVTGGDTRFGSGGLGYSYDITMNDANTAAGRVMVISANTLRTDEMLTFNGAAELDGRFRIFSGDGADAIVGGAGADEIWGRGGADRITGGGGADILRGGDGANSFVYLTVGDSGAAALDQVLDFKAGDRIDLAGIDANSLNGAGDDPFRFVAGGAFSGGGAAGAGELIATLSNGVWTVAGDIDGDGRADFMLQVTALDGHVLGAADFVL